VHAEIVGEQNLLTVIVQSAALSRQKYAIMTATRETLRMSATESVTKTQLSRMVRHLLQPSNDMGSPATTKKLMQGTHHPIYLRTVLLASGTILPNIGGMTSIRAIGTTPMMMSSMMGSVFFIINFVMSIIWLFLSSPSLVSAEAPLAALRSYLWCYPESHVAEVRSAGASVGLLLLTCTGIILER